MTSERIFKVLLAPHMTEKTSSVEDKANQYVFRVVKDASKTEIKDAVEHLFEVKVMNVRTVLVKGKTKAFKGRAGKRPDWKKAYVRLSEGQTIEQIGAE
ncbi:MAG: 50S ribosomal protein L23 [bacterium]